MLVSRTIGSRFALLCVFAVGGAYAHGVPHQTNTATPVIVGGLPYSVAVSRYDAQQSFVRPAVHSFVAGEHNGQWVIIGGLTNGLHGFDIDNDTIPERKQNADVWVIDPVAKTSWSRSLVPGEAGSGLTSEQLLSIYTSNAQFEQVGDRLYVTGGFGDDDVLDPASRNTFDFLTAFDLPGLVDWAKGGSGQAVDHIRQLQDDMFKVTGGEMVAIDGQMHLVFGHDFNQAYAGNSINGDYTKQVRTFTIQDDGVQLAITDAKASTPQEYYRRRDLNVFPTLRSNNGELEQGVTVLSGVFTNTRGAWTVPVEIDADGNPVQRDNGLDPLNTGGVLDQDSTVFKQGMNNYHSAKLGMFSEASGDMQELLFGGITLQQYDEMTGSFVTDNGLPNTNQISSVVRRANGEYEQHYLGAFPEIYTDEATPQLLRFGSNAEFFAAEGTPTYSNGVIAFDLLPYGDSTLGYIFGGVIANAPHVFMNPAALSSASGEIFAVTISIQAGDYNRDGWIDAADYTVWRDNLGRQVAAGTSADGDGDGYVTAADLDTWRAGFAATPVIAASVPEPHGLWLLVSAIGTAIACWGSSKGRSSLFGPS
ncbi:hypothetical protein Pla175_25680 [Pirellulimonas nuda]|uniref:Kelch motif protein n=1 Tax=Pirellulimonas nuda TaxID=2528009 RepID=A0A518DCH3_9BACT|nr:hypothetical protein [Pirellulimonas nuda]QDU89181.1 hypothetical protein Pla175_25680 [Pirellulimonas nuda]